MEIDLQPGRYVVAVSGGVDSMALLHILTQKSKYPVPGTQYVLTTGYRELAAGDSGRWRLVVAHFDHGIRPDSAEDRRLVQTAAAEYGLPFVYEEGKLGQGASEATARHARYNFLRRVQQEQQATAIVTAHHQDDVLETAILNLLRGTGRRGLTALADKPALRRPLLNVPKQTLIDYAREHNLRWHEDSTNTDERYLRNYIRRQIVPRFSAADRDKLLAIITRSRNTNDELDRLLAGVCSATSQPHEFSRLMFSQLPHQLAKETLATWLRANSLTQFDAATLERVTVAAKTQRPGAIIDIVGNARLQVTEHSLALEYRER